MLKTDGIMTRGAMLRMPRREGNRPLALPIRANTGVVPPQIKAVDFLNGFLRRDNSGIVPPRFPWPSETGSHPATPMPIPDRASRLAHLLPFRLGIVTGAYPGLGDNAAITLPDLSMNVSAGSTGQMVPNFTPIMPAVPVTPVMSSTIPDTGSGSWGALISNVLGGALKMGTQYEMGRLQANLLQKTYNPQNVAANIQAYQGAAAQTAAQAQAEQMARELEFERQTGARAGSVVSSGVVILGLAGLATFLLLRKPAASKKAA